MTYSDSILQRCPHLVDDEEIRPLLQRMSNVEHLLNATISKHRAKSKEPLETNLAYTRFTHELNLISNDILTILRDRLMRDSIARLERGKKLLRIPG